jgi:hypothetical protein
MYSNTTTDTPSENSTNNTGAPFNPFISAYPTLPDTTQQMNNNRLNSIFNPTPTAPPAYVPPPMYQRAKSQEELDREGKDAELARALFAEQKPRIVCETPSTLTYNLSSLTTPYIMHTIFSNLISFFRRRMKSLPRS